MRVRRGLRRKRGWLACAVAGLIVVAACGARSSLDVVASSSGAGGAPLVCPSWDTCAPPPDDCMACVTPRIAACAGITDCDPGPDGCSGALGENHACGRPRRSTAFSPARTSTFNATIPTSRAARVRSFRWALPSMISNAPSARTARPSARRRPTSPCSADRSDWSRMPVSRA